MRRSAKPIIVGFDSHPVLHAFEAAIDRSVWDLSKRLQ
jgi:hypothetical protein